MFSIVSFFHRAVLPTVFEVRGEFDERFLGSDDVIFVGKFLPDDEHAHERYKTLAKQYRDRFTFAASIPVQEQSQSSIMCRNNINDEEHTLTELWRVEALESFLRLCSEPLIPEITKKNEERYAQVNLPQREAAPFS